MNYPDLETCSAIAGEFPESEFIHIFANNKLHKTVKREDEGVYYGAGYDIVPAPTCEELGDWMRKNSPCDQIGGIQRKDGLWVFFDFGSSTRDNFFVEADNETQARAEAVKLILGNK